tara:strand:+ start:2190 stop:2543 length:354 start_codon:yes stop_codon:yes gene_type:complete
MKPEERLQTAVVEYLGYILPSNSFFHHSPNEGKRHVAFKLKLKKMGFKAGFPDLAIWVANKPTIFIELKAGKNKQTASQLDVQKQLENLGCYYAVCHTLPDVDNFLKKVLTDGRRQI